MSGVARMRSLPPKGARRTIFVPLDKIDVVEENGAHVSRLVIGDRVIDVEHDAEAIAALLGERNDPAKPESKAMRAKLEAEGKEREVDFERMVDTLDALGVTKQCGACAMPMIPNRTCWSCGSDTEEPWKLRKFDDEDE